MFWLKIIDYKILLDNKTLGDIANIASQKISLFFTYKCKVYREQYP